MKLGKHSYVIDLENVNLQFQDSGHEFIVGNFCSIATGLTVFLGGNHRPDRITTYPFGHASRDIFNKFDGSGHPASKGDVVVGNDVWIGAYATIMSGVNIGDGAVIGARSVVTKNVSPYTIVAGNPAKIIKARFSDDVITELLRIKWWNWDDELVNQMTPLLCSDNINLFIKTANSLNIANNS